VNSVPEKGDEDSDCYYEVRKDKSFLPIIAALRARYPDKTQKLKILQIASGFGQFGSFLEQENMEPIMVDISKDNIRWGKEHGTSGGIMADAGALPFENSSMHAVVSDHFLCSAYGALTEKKEEEISKEARRVLKKDGILILSNHSMSSLLTGFIYEPYITSDFKMIHQDASSLLAGRIAILQKRNMIEMVPLRRLFNKTRTNIRRWRDYQHYKMLYDSEKLNQSEDIDMS